MNALCYVQRYKWISNICWVKCQTWMNAYYRYHLFEILRYTKLIHGKKNSECRKLLARWGVVKIMQSHQRTFWGDINNLSKLTKVHLRDNILLYTNFVYLWKKWKLIPTSHTINNIQLWQIAVLNVKNKTIKNLE